MTKPGISTCADIHSSLFCAPLLQVVWKLARLQLLLSTSPSTSPSAGPAPQLLTAAVVLDELRLRCSVLPFTGLSIACPQLQLFSRLLELAGRESSAGAGYPCAPPHLFVGQTCRNWFTMTAGMSGSSTAATVRCSSRCCR